MPEPSFTDLPSGSVVWTELNVLPSVTINENSTVVNLSRQLQVLSGYAEIELLSNPPRIVLRGGQSEATKELLTEFILPA